MPADKLALFNQALGHLGERRIASLTEEREPRRLLEDYWPGVLAHGLEMGAWKFALRSARLDASHSVAPEFGFTKAFRKPDDWVRTFALSDNESFTPPLLRYREERGYWHADCDPLYLHYVSNDATFGGLDLSRWTQLFEDYVALRLALLACPRISGAESRAESLRRQERKALAAAREHDAAAEPPQFQPGGSWARSRGGGSASR